MQLASCFLLLFLPPANEVWGKVIFSEVCVKNSVHRGSAWSLGVPGSGGVPGLWGSGPSMPCRFPGPHPRRKFRGIWSRPTSKGEVEGDLVQSHSQGEVEGDLVRAHPLPATAAGGTHPTGMHPCFSKTLS